MPQAAQQAAGKPTVESLNVDVSALTWQRSGDGDGAVEIAFVGAVAGQPAQWVLMRIAGDPAGRVLVYDRHEWECFVAGVRGGEFDDAVREPQDRAAGDESTEPR